MTEKQSLWFVTFLTFVRVPLIFLFFVGALVHLHMPSTGLFVFTFSAMVLSALTDLFDGYFARRLEVTTPLGAYADPLTDKIVYLTTLPLLVFLATRGGDLLHATVLLVFTVLFMLRDQWVTFLRSIGSLYDVSAKANWSGKLRTIINFPLMCIIYFREVHPEVMSMTVLYVLEGAGLLINLISMYVYTRNYLPYLGKAMKVKSGDRKPREESD